MISDIYTNDSQPTLDKLSNRSSSAAPAPAEAMIQQIVINAGADASHEAFILFSDKSGSGTCFRFDKHGALGGAC